MQPQAPPASGPAYAEVAGEDPLAHVRPLSVGDILDLALRLYRRHFKTLFLVMVGLQIPLFLVGKIPEIASRSVFPGGTDPQMLMLLPAEELVAGFVVLFGANLAAIAALTVLAAFAGGAIVHGGTQAWRGETPTPAGCYGALKGRLPALAGTQLLLMLLLVLAITASALPGGFLLGAGAAAGSLGLIALGTLAAVAGIIVVALALYLRWFLVVPVVMLDGLSGMRALSRSAELMSGNVGPGLMGLVKVRASLVLLVVFFIIIVPSLMIGIPKLVLAAQYSSAEALDVTAIPLLIRLPIESAELLMAAILTPFSVLTVLLVYLDLRIRKEGYDLEVRAQAMGEAAGGPVAPGPGAARTDPDATGAGEAAGSGHSAAGTEDAATGTGGGAT